MVFGTHAALSSARALEAAKPACAGSARPLQLASPKARQQGDAEEGAVGPAKDTWGPCRRGTEI
jgi:hypothetical protein